MTDQTSVAPSAFPLAERKALGYEQRQVDTFLDRARSTYERREGSGTALTSAEVRRASFAMKKGGYAPRYVDAALDRLEEVFYERERRERIREIGEDAWWQETRALLSEVRGRLGRPRRKRFARRGIFATGYRRSEVDAFLDRVQEMFDQRELSFTPADVRDVVFHTEWRGYDEAQVDALLDGVVELILATRAG